MIFISPTLSFQTIPEFKLVLLGDNYVGKSEFIQHHVTNGTMTPLGTTIHANGLQIQRLQFNNSLIGPVIFNIWEVPAREIKCPNAPNRRLCPDGCTDCDNLRRYLNQTDCAICMFDVISRTTFRSVCNHWEPAVKEVCGDDVPILVAGTKIDIRDRKIKARQILFWRSLKHTKNANTYSLPGRFRAHEFQMLWRNFSVAVGATFAPTNHGTLHGSATAEPRSVRTACGRRLATPGESYVLFCVLRRASSVAHCVHLLTISCSFFCPNRSSDPRFAHQSRSDSAAQSRPHCCNVSSRRLDDGRHRGRRCLSRPYYIYNPIANEQPTSSSSNRFLA